MSTYVLIHGAAHGAWCWKKIVPLLEREGHSVITPDLPGHGDDMTPAGEVTLRAYVDRVCTILDEQTESAILVGHSIAGIVITQTAEYRPSRIQKLVYLTALVPANGQTMLQTTAEINNPENIVIAEDRSWYRYKDERLKALFYDDCSDGDIAFAVSKLCPEPMRPIQQPIHVSEGKYGRVPKVYIECLRDRIMPISFQRKMYLPIGCEQVITMDTSHSPFFSAPDELGKQLLSLAG